MSACIWCINKYAALPSARKGSARSFLLLREMVRLGHTCVLITSDSNHLTDPPEFRGTRHHRSEDGVDVYWLRTLKFRQAKSFRRILSWLHFEWRLWRMPKRQLPRPDAIIVSSLSLLTIISGLRLKRKYRCRLIFEIRDIWPLTLVEEGGFSRRNPFVMALGLIERLGYRKADAIVGTMPNLGQHVAEVCRTAAPVHCIPFGIDENMLATGAPIPDQWVLQHVPKGKFIVCYAGTLGITNALDPLFDCARRMKDHQYLHFLIVGEGDLRQAYQTQYADLPNLTFTGAVPKDSVQSVLRLCDLLYFSTFPSRVWDYGLSLNKVIDYMLAAKPVVASHSGYPTMIDEAGSGTSISAGDGPALEAEILRWLSLPKAKREAIGQQGRDWLVQHRPYDRLARDYLSILLPAAAGLAQKGGSATSPRVPGHALAPPTDRL